VQAHRMAAEVHRKAGRWEEARQHLERVVRGKVPIVRFPTTAVGLAFVNSITQRRRFRHATSDADCTNCSNGMAYRANIFWCVGTKTPTPFEVSWSAPPPSPMGDHSIEHKQARLRKCPRRRRDVGPHRGSEIFRGVLRPCEPCPKRSARGSAREEGAREASTGHVPDESQDAAKDTQRDTSKEIFR
jgi:hypothetical protein